MSKRSFILGTFFFLPTFALAQTSVITIMDDLINIMQTIMPVLLGCAVAVFFWGVVKFIWHADDEKAVQEGRMFLVWGMVGIFVIVALWSIIGFIQTELGLAPLGGLGTAPTIQTTVPI